MFPLSFTAFNILYWVSYSQGEVIFNWNDHKLTGGVYIQQATNILQFSFDIKPLYCSGMRGATQLSAVTPANGADLAY